MMSAAGVEEAAVWAGSVLLDPGRLIYAGRVGPAHQHRHGAVLLALARSGRLTFVDQYGERRTAAAAVVPTLVPHTMQGMRAQCLLAYLDPAGSVAAAVRELFVGRNTRSVRAWVELAAPAVAAAGGHPQPREALTAALRALVGDHLPAGGSVEHPALRSAIDLVLQRLDEPMRLTEVAEAVGLSPDRLGHLFADKLGLSFPVYVRWQRIRWAMVRVQLGATLTDAAHAAGFTDSAHLTRVVHEMFGVAPSILARRLRWA